MTSLEKAKAIVKVLDEKKGRDIQLLEIRGLSTLGDYFILASGGSNTQVKALSDEVDEEMHKQFVLKQQESQYAAHAMHLRGQAINLQKYIQKTGCTLDEAFDFFEIPEEDRKPMAEWIKV